MQQAKEDGATVAIYYESRLAKLRLKDTELASIDDEVDELAEDEEESTQAKLKSRWAALERWWGPSHGWPAWRPIWWRILRRGRPRRPARRWWWR
ncbi:hypothetical protein ACVBEH_17595 [Roseateles sp. GG27B]